MSSFEFVFGLLSIIASLGLTHLVASVVALIRNSERVRFSPLHALWMWTAFSTTIANWGSYWTVRGQTSWPSALVLLSLAVALGQYAFCALVSPRVEGTGPIDLVEFHARERRRYAFAFLSLIIAAFVSDGMFLAAGTFYAGWVRDLVIVVLEFALVLLAIFAAARPAQWIAVLGASTLSTIGMVDACNILSA